MANFGAPNFLAAIDAYEKGADRARRSYLMELDERARGLQGAALQGDQNALAELGTINPEAAMQTTQFTQQQKKERLGEFLSAAYSAKTPEAWNGVVQRFKAQGHNFGPGEDAFENRENLIRQGMSVAEQMGMDLQGQKFAADTARDQRNFAALQDYRGRSLDIQQQALNAKTAQAQATAAAKKNPPMNASMLKLKRETENNILDLQNTQAVLGRALDLAPKAYTGVGAGTRAYLGSRLPDYMVPDSVADPKTSADTTEFGNIMSMEAIQSMSNSLKGATTDFELKKFENILSDPSTPAEIKKATINRMLKLADSKLALEQQRLDEFGGDIPQPGGTQPTNDTQGDNADFFIQQANDAIAAGADPEAVKARLRDLGVDTEFGQ